MIPFILGFLHDLFKSEEKFTLWARSLLQGLAASGVAFGSELIQYGVSEPTIRRIKLASVVLAFLSVAFKAGDRNPPTPTA